MSLDHVLRTRKQEKLIADFDRIAKLPEENWNANKHFYPYLLRYIPESNQRILDMGCGTGDFCLEIINKSPEVTGLDISSAMISVAKHKCSIKGNVNFLLGDYLQIEFPPEHFDCIISVAAVHHLNMPEFLIKAGKELKPNGRLIVLDLYKEESILDYALSFLSFALSKLFNLFYNQSLIRTKEYNQLWKEHGQEDTYLSFTRISNHCNRYLPGAYICRHLFWRYSLIWIK